MKISLPLLLLLFTPFFYCMAEDKSLPAKEDIIINDEGIIVTHQDAAYMLSDMSEDQKNKTLSNVSELKNLLLDFSTLKKKAREARNSKLHENKLIQWKINKTTNQILSAELAKKYSNNIKTSKQISESLAKEYYDSHPEKYTVPEKVKVAHILFFTKDLDSEQKKELMLKATKLLDELKKGKDFSEAAKEFSEDPSNSNTGGDLGYFERGKMVKPFEEVAFKLENKNQLSEIVETQFGYHILKLLDRKKMHTIAYKDIKSKLMIEQEDILKKRKTNDYLKDFETTTNTNIYSPALNQAFTELKLKQKNSPEN